MLIPLEEEPEQRQSIFEASKTGRLQGFTHLAQLMARAQRESILSGSEWLLPVLESRPAKTMGSRPPSSSGSATWAARSPQKGCTDNLKIFSVSC